MKHGAKNSQELSTQKLSTFGVYLHLILGVKSLYTDFLEVYLENFQASMMELFCENS